ncbi:MAG: HAD-IA family hydrolase [Spirochaetes bacterium]|nr:HAD-IA family hydrolase [Spirochaetota bacterium]
MKKYNTYLFDADGTIIDTADLIIESYRNTLEHYGAAPQTRENILRFMGIPFAKQMELYMGTQTPEKMKEINRFHWNYQVKIHEEFLKEGPGTSSALAMLKKNAAKLAVVTSRTRSTLDMYLKKLNILHFFDLTVTPEDVVNPKPHHESCSKALEILKSEAEETLFVGDAIYDQQSAKGVNIDFAYVQWSHIPIEKFSPEPEYILKNMTDLLK